MRGLWGRKEKKSSWRDMQIWKREKRVRELRMGNWMKTWEKGPRRWRGGVRPFSKGVSGREKQEREDGTGSVGPIGSGRPLRLRCWLSEACHAGIVIRGSCPGIEFCSPFLCSLSNSIPHPVLPTFFPWRPM